jgi:hypothetical protein
MKIKQKTTCTQNKRTSFHSPEKNTCFGQVLFFDINASIKALAVFEILYTFHTPPAFNETKAVNL